MNISTWIKVARYHMADRISLTLGPWGILVFDFAVFLAVVAMMGPARHPQSQSGALAAIYVCFLVLGALSIFRALPFGLALGVSRRSYYAGTTLLALVLAAVYGLADRKSTRLNSSHRL